jgi:hypothetical protein
MTATSRNGPLARGGPVPVATARFGRSRARDAAYRCRDRRPDINPTTHARLGLADDTLEFCPQFDPILFSAEPDYSVCNSRLQWEARDFRSVALYG